MKSYLDFWGKKDISIKELAYLIKEIIGYKGEFYFDASKPDGTMRKVTNVSKLNSLGWSYKTSLKKESRRCINGI